MYSLAIFYCWILAWRNPPIKFGLNSIHFYFFEINNTEYFPYMYRNNFDEEQKVFCSIEKINFIICKIMFNKDFIIEFQTLYNHIIIFVFIRAHYVTIQIL
jgi:hypothetical protein